MYKQQVIILEICTKEVRALILQSNWSVRNWFFLPTKYRPRLNRSIGVGVARQIYQVNWLFIFHRGFLMINFSSNFKKKTVFFLSGIKRPLGPPPPTPSRLSHGRSNESLSSMSSEVDGTTQLNPVPPPRKVSHSCEFRISFSKNE